jgi:hypothetical protein
MTLPQLLLAASVGRNLPGAADYPRQLSDSSTVVDA